MHSMDLPPALSFVADWRTAIDSVGTDGFADEVLRSFGGWSAVSHCAAVAVEGGDLRLITADAELDSSVVLPLARSLVHDGYHKVRSGTSERHLVRNEIPADGGGTSAHGVSDAVLAQGEREGRHFGLLLLRKAPAERFTGEELDCIDAVAGTWLSLVAKHDRLTGERATPDSTPVLLGAVSHIESKLKTVMPSLTKRESQVCARILRGMSTPGIAVDLNVREDSVATYRKRAYRRLEIGTRFELIQLFISGCARHSTPPGRDPVPALAV